MKEGGWDGRRSDKRKSREERIKEKHRLITNWKKLLKSDISTPIYSDEESTGYLHTFQSNLVHFKLLPGNQPPHPPERQRSLSELPAYRGNNGQPDAEPSSTRS